MYDLTLINHNGGVYIDSREVAKLIEKRHDNLLRDIQKYCKHIIGSAHLKIEVSRFFLESSYLDSTGRELPCYLLSKMGCEMVANKLTGEKGILFTAVYVSKFNEMEKAKMAELERQSIMPAPRLGEYNAAARLIVRSLQNMGATAEQIIEFLKNLYEPLGIVVADDTDFVDSPRLYTAKQIAKLLGVYSINGNPHYQAIACIINENLFIGEQHKTIVTSDYGNHIGVSVRYSLYALNAVSEWLVENQCPSEIYGTDRTYYVTYNSKLFSY